MSKKLFCKGYLYLFFLIFFSLGFFYFFPQKTYAGCALTGTYHIMCTCPVGCPSPMCDPFCSGGSFPGDWCATARCNPSTGCWSENFYICDPPDACCQGCFTGETEVSVGQESERAGEQEGDVKEIKDLKPGDIVSSFNPETGEIKEGMVSDIYKITREGYYELETESGKKVKVTGEHPFLAVKNSSQASVDSSQDLVEDLKAFLSHTLTYRLITDLQAKIVEVLK